MENNDSKHLWFLDTLVFIRVAESDGSDGISVIEHQAYPGDSPPLHIHHGEDEVFLILEGDFRFSVGGKVHKVKAGGTMLIPKGMPHSYRVESPGGGRWLTVTTGGDFERFVRAMARPAEQVQLPARMGAPSQEVIEQLNAQALAHNIEIVGPPLH